VQIVTLIVSCASQNFPESAVNFSAMNGIVMVRQTEFADFEALHDAMQDGPSEIVQLEPGKMTGRCGVAPYRC
jgi:hypothetical protein